MLAADCEDLTDVMGTVNKVEASPVAGTHGTQDSVGNGAG